MSPTPTPAPTPLEALALFLQCIGAPVNVEDVVEVNISHSSVEVRCRDASRQASVAKLVIGGWRWGLPSQDPDTAPTQRWPLNS